MSDAPKLHKKTKSLKNWLTVSGAIVSLAGLFAFAFLFFIDSFAHHGNPYMGILAYVIAPGFIIGGVVFAIVGAWLHARRSKKVDYNISIDLTRPRDRRIAIVFTIGAALFL